MASGSSNPTGCSGHALIAWLSHDGEASCPSPEADEGPDDDEGSAYNDEADGDADLLTKFLLRTARGGGVVLH